VDTSNSSGHVASSVNFIAFGFGVVEGVAVPIAADGSHRPPVRPASSPCA
jgi:hypothetical protein